MKHVCVTAKNDDDAKGDAGLIANKAKSADKVSVVFALTLRAVTIFAQGCVTRLAHIRDMLCGVCLALSKNRDSASRVSFC